MLEKWPATSTSRLEAFRQKKPVVRYSPADCRTFRRKVGAIRKSNGRIWESKPGFKLLLKAAKTANLQEIAG